MNRSARSIAAESAFRERLAGLGAVMLEPVWLGGNKAHHVRCAAGHDSHPYPSNVMRGEGICRTCAGKDPAVAEAAFRARLAELGATPLFERYLGANKPHVIHCAAGHECRPTPSRLRAGYGPCRKCGNRQIDSARSRQAEAAFRATLLRLGATPLYTEWLGTAKPHHVRCAAGHDCQVRPANVQQGQGFCRACAGQDPILTEAAFRARLAGMGATPLFDHYLGSHEPHAVRCAAGHDCRMRPRDVLKGRRSCRVCARTDPAAAEAWFRARLAELGATALYETWGGARHPHHIRCAAGHDCWPTPDSLRRNGPCATCAGNDTLAAEAAFRARVTALGGACLFAEWQGVNRPHHVRCAAGHECRPRPGNVLSGLGICRACAGRAWDVFYVVTSPLVVKFGVTSGDPRPRLANHAKHGCATIERVATGLPGTTAPDTENAVKAALALAGERPVRGKEYFDISCLALVLDIADSWLAAEVPI